MREIIFMVLLISFNFFVFGQNNFGLKIGAGANYTSAVLDRDYYETPEDIELYEIQGGTGYNLRIGVNYLILPKFLINCNINYLNSNYKYNIYDELPPDTPLPIVDSGDFKSKISNSSIGVSIGPEVKILNFLSLSYNLTFYKVFHQKIETEIKYWKVFEPKFESKTETWDKLKNEFCNSLELAFFVKDFRIIPGIELNLSKSSFYPAANNINTTENSGTKYRYYLLVSYSITGK